MQCIPPKSKKFRKIDIEHIIQQLPTPFILLGDFNAHSPIWGSIKTDARGKEIETLLEKDNIALLNDSTPNPHKYIKRKFFMYRSDSLLCLTCT